MQAENSLAQVQRIGGLQAGQVRLLGPQDARASHRDLFARTLEPEPRGIARTFIQTHVVGGMAGGFVGLALFTWFYKAGHPMILSSPLLAAIALVGFGITFGLLLGGLLSIRPDHVLLITKVRSALRHNRWAVVTHPTSPEQTAKVKEVLQGNAEEVVSTL